MKTRNYSIKEEHIKWLEDHSEKTGIPMSAIIRMAIDLFKIREHEKEVKYGTK